MDFLHKLFNPLKNNKDRKYKDLSKESRQVQSKPPSELLLYSRDAAGEQIQKLMNVLNDCRWIRSEYTYPSFDNMNFIYKNTVFSVLIDIQDKNGASFLPEIYIKRQITAAKEHNLIPCKFPVSVNDPYKPDLKTLTPLNKGWNLFHTETNKPVIPEHLATTENVLMSEWEKRNFAIIFLRKYLNLRKLKVLSFQDTLEVDPQLWFEDKNGRICWAVVRCFMHPEKSTIKPEQIKELVRRCFTNEGYFAGVILKPLSEDGKLYRCGKTEITFNGLEKIHSVM